MTNTNRLTLLDGGTGRELQRMGAPFRQPEWSALSLMEAPSAVQDVHHRYLSAGTDVVTANSYAVTPFHIGAERFASDGLVLADRAGRIGRAAIDSFGRGRLAGSLPPVLGSYRPDLFSETAAAPILDRLIEGLAPHVDVWLGETLSSIPEARLVAGRLTGRTAPLWLSFTLMDDALEYRGRLRSGEAVADAARAALELGAEALLFNCSQPEVMAEAVSEARAAMGAANLQIGVYANAFPPQPKHAVANDGLDPIREDLTPQTYLQFASQWAERGASIVGGCCGVGPEHIAALAAARDTLAHAVR
eukprot:gene9231-9311_t